MSDGDIEDKLYVFLGFREKEAMFFKTTSKTRLYDAAPELLSGCVVYAGGQVPEFPKPRTIIDTAQTVWGIRRTALQKILTSEPGRLKRVMPNDFEARLRKAIQQAGLLSDPDKAERLAIIGPPTSP
jgi:hypothetical protein